MEDADVQKKQKTVTKDAVVKLAGEVITELLHLRINTDKNRAGGWVAVFDRNTGEVIVHSKVGEITRVSDPDYITKEWKYRQLSYKKAHQLQVYAKMSSHISGWQHKDDAKDQFGGAVLGERYVFAFSGLSEHADEIVSLLLADAFDTVDCAAVVAISQNPFWPQMSLWWHGTP